MIPEYVLRRAVEGGWRPLIAYPPEATIKLVTGKIVWWQCGGQNDQGQWLSEIILDPLFWQAIFGTFPCKADGMDNHFGQAGYIFHAHHFLDLILNNAPQETITKWWEEVVPVK